MKEGQEFEQAVRQALDAQSESLDGATLYRLRRARATALDQGGGVSGVGRRRPGHWLMPVAGVAGLLAGVVGLSVWLQSSAPSDPVDAIINAEGTPIEVVTADVDVELLEDLDFYDWLMLMETNGDSA
jgi:hypothetical protein